MTKISAVWIVALATGLLLIPCTRALSDSLNGFNLHGSLIPRSEIKRGGPPRDGIPALTNPDVMPASGAAYLRARDLVIGVEIGNEARAYPLRILDWHELVNDTLANMNILVSYCPLCKSALVFDRNIGGAVREFGVSGLLWNSNVLLYDRQKKGMQESLWSQIRMEAVTGPASAKRLTLTLLPMELVTWSDWKARHPATTVLSMDTGHRRNYRGQAYQNYFASDHLMFPVSNTRSRDPRFRNKELMAVVFAGRDTRAYAASDVAKAAGNAGFIREALGGRTIRLYPVDGQASIRVAAEAGTPLPVGYMFYFALHAMHPEIEVYKP